MDDTHKTTLRIPMDLFRRAHQLWQRGQGEGWISLKVSRAVYLVQLMRRGVEAEEKEHPVTARKK